MVDTTLAPSVPSSVERAGDISTKMTTGGSIFISSKRACARRMMTSEAASAEERGPGRFAEAITLRFANSSEGAGRWGFGVAATVGVEGECK